MSKKGLQKFTDFEKLETAEEFTELLETNKEKFNDLVKWLQVKVNEAVKKDTPDYCEVDRYFNRIEKIFPIAYPQKNKKEEIVGLKNLKRQRWYVNDQLIKNFINKQLLDYSYLPTNTDISSATGLSRVTIDKHIKEGKTNYTNDEVEKYKMMNSKVINRIYKLGMTENNLKALKLFIDYTGEPKQTTINNNYIQINNTRIDSVLIEQLPIETRNQIEALILNNRLI